MRFGQRNLKPERWNSEQMPICVRAYPDGVGCPADANRQ